MSTSQLWQAKHTEDRPAGQNTTTVNASPASYHFTFTGKQCEFSELYDSESKLLYKHEPRRAVAGTQMQTNQWKNKTLKQTMKSIFENRNKTEQNRKNQSFCFVQIE